MDENKMGWREYARYAEMSVEEWRAIARCRCFARQVRADRA